MLCMAKPIKRGPGRPKVRSTPVGKSGKTGKALTAQVDEDIMEALHKYCNGPGGERRVQASVINTALRKYLKEVGAFGETLNDQQLRPNAN